MLNIEKRLLRLERGQENGHTEVTRIELVPLRRPGELVGAEQQIPVVVFDLNHHPKSTVGARDMTRLVKLELPGGGKQS